MNFIAGLLLLFYDEERAFIQFLMIVERLLPHGTDSAGSDESGGAGGGGGYYTQTMSGAQTDVFVVRSLMRKTPKLFAHIEQNKVDWSAFALPMLITLFINSLPLEVFCFCHPSLYHRRPFRGSSRPPPLCSLFA
jgi:hypothetical protein